MSSTTKRWMKEELQQLLEQRERYQLAEATARDVAQARRRTIRMRALDEEILGRREALAALEPAAPIPPRKRAPTLVSPTIGSTLALMQPRPALATSLAKVVGGSFALGFAATALLLVVTSPGPRDRQAAGPLPAAPAPAAAPARVHPASRPAPRPAVDASVHAATAEPARPRAR
jgi:hypothetical protein